MQYQPLFQGHRGIASIVQYYEVRDSVQGAREVVVVANRSTVVDQSLQMQVEESTVFVFISP